MCTALACLDSQERGLVALAAEIRNCDRSCLRELRLGVVPSGVVLCGFATSYYGKQLALHEVRRRCGLRVTANRIVVVDAVRIPFPPSGPVGG